jgi:hypothetical protein
VYTLQEVYDTVIQMVFDHNLPYFVTRDLTNQTEGKEFLITNGDLIFPDIEEVIARVEVEEGQIQWHIAPNHEKEFGCLVRHRTYLF